MAKHKHKFVPPFEAFLADLRVVYFKHKMVVDSCGCCGSPWAVKVAKSEDPKEVERVVENAIRHLSLDPPK